MSKLLIFVLAFVILAASKHLILDTHLSIGPCVNGLCPTNYRCINNLCVPKAPRAAFKKS